ncbi:hypothetical protein ACGFX4_11695 [Kitasatospora sp. NPDC048365]|uniref:hypothetical protein n=1 Tax=Kitasatospora sp. NPDC048365 TaxID=3364050 RepID=UPI003715D6C7
MHVEIPALTPAEPGRKTVVTVPVREGGSTVGSYALAAGEVVVVVVCSDGDLVVRLEPASVSTVICPPGTVTPVRNVFRLLAPQDVDVRVEAPAGARWTLRIEQPDR